MSNITAHIIKKAAKAKIYIYYMGKNIEEAMHRRTHRMPKRDSRELRYATYEEFKKISVNLICLQRFFIIRTAHPTEKPHTPPSPHPPQ